MSLFPKILNYFFKFYFKIEMKFNLFCILLPYLILYSTLHFWVSLYLFLPRRSFCSGSGRVGLVRCVWIIHLQQDGQQSCHSAAAAAEHTYLNLNLQQLIVLTNPPAFPHYYFF